MTEDEIIVAYAACRGLRQVYDAYQFASRAHRLVLSRLAEGAATHPRPVSEEERLRRELELSSRYLLATQADATFGRRSDQLRDRMLILRGFPVRK
jgi:hypothetical protein